MQISITSFKRLLLFNNRVYRYTGNNIRELYNGEYTNEITYSNKYIYRLKKYNGYNFFIAHYLAFDLNFANSPLLKILILSVK